MSRPQSLSSKESFGKERRLCDCCCKARAKGHWILIDLFNEEEYIETEVAWYCLSCFISEAIPRSRIIRSKQHFQEIMKKSQELIKKSEQRTGVSASE